MTAKVIIKGKLVEEYRSLTLQDAIEYMQWWFHDYAWYTKKVFIIEDENGEVIFRSEDDNQHK